MKNYPIGSNAEEIERIGLTGLCPEPDWYAFHGNDEKIGSKLKGWHQRIDPEKVKDQGVLRYINAKRKLALCKVLILRAHGFVTKSEDGFNFLNKFDRREHRIYMSRGRNT